MIREFLSCAPCEQIAVKLKSETLSFTGSLKDTAGYFIEPGGSWRLLNISNACISFSIFRNSFF